ncbi:alpha/beta hydrolase family protein [Poritiphilus flavus]|uniref:Alpha/beta fold hydrolase n=1 Tax=Poritiphilus flavus TaxID=2697053 RepID=A0A6L9EI50_9FLAO|nr:alpha/beta fold hydrolase [Poritiphilus flavus]NAS13879.1 alpha/beta fold hydrolase [Poritiphilus flavus]
MKPIDITCEDGMVIKGDHFPAQADKQKHKVVIINSATAVSRGLYMNYARYLAANGFEVITYDYRGIADSRPDKLRGFHASFTAWGQLDFTAVLAYAKTRLPDHKILIMGHSIGGTIVGMSEKCSIISGIINIGAQTSYYKDWDKDRYRLYFLWHILFPAVTQVYGYFPGKKLGLLEDIPKGIIAQWNARKKDPNMVHQMENEGNQLFFDRFQGKLLTLAIEDDVIGTEKAIQRVYELFTSASTAIKHISPDAIGAKKIGHFGFFSRRFKHSLWEQTADWYEKV